MMRQRILRATDDECPHIAPRLQAMTLVNFLHFLLTLGLLVFKSVSVRYSLYMHRSLLPLLFRMPGTAALQDNV